MTIRTILLLVPFIALQACGSSDRPVLAPEAIYAEPGMSIITTLFNDSAQTTSVLYGNALAVASAQDTASSHRSGEQYRLVTWRQKGNPLWFGGNINDSIQAVERIMVLDDHDSEPAIRYDVPVGTVTDKPGDRIKLIFGLKGLEFPVGLE
ncbi:hypothetical protein [Dawidia soli]|uniref:Uncharacterized protein n=1 Tax=Dawidia soli TaxID=2782352 RepID=A0AAP2DG62_9BACT|nr:hypothetical protein [Dawidia soli]MBT1690692.1 hypothetical protein [Dawidia soli]